MPSATKSEDANKPSNRAARALDAMISAPAYAPDVDVRTAMTLRFAGRKYKSVDWSLGGCRIAADSAQFQTRQQITGRIRLAGADGQGEFVAEIERVDSDGHLVLRWLEISPHIFLAMHGLA